MINLGSTRIEYFRNFMFTCFSNFSRSFIILLFPKHNKSSLPIWRENLEFIKFPSKAPISSSYVARSCKIQSNLNTSFSSGRDVVFFKSFRTACGIAVVFDVFKFFSHKFSKSDTFCKYSSMSRFRWNSFSAKRQWVATYLMIISAIGRPVMSR